MATFVVPTIYTAIDKFTAPVRKMAAASTKFARKTEIGVARADRAFRKLLTPIRAVTKAAGRLGLVLGATAILGIAGAGIGVFKNFEQANASLASVMNTTAANAAKLSKDAERLGAVTAKTASEVVGLQESFARLGFTTPEIVNMTEATIAGSIAMQGELAETAELVGAVVKTFDKFSSIDTPEIIDQMTLATQKSALNFEKLQTALPIVGGAANALGIPFTKVLALMGKLSDAGIDASSSATALRNIFLESTKRGIPYQKLLDNVSKSTNSLGLANSLFGKRGAVVATVLSKNIKKTAELDLVLQSAAAGMENSGTATKSAAKQLDTLTGSLTILNSAYEGFILSLDNGTGAFSGHLKMASKVTTELLALAGGAALSTFKLTDQQKAVRENTKTALKWLGAIKNTVIGLVALKGILLLTKGALFTYRLGLGITLGLQGLNSIALKGHTAALFANAVAAKVASAATFIWGAALNIGLLPLTLIALAIAALIALIVIVVKNFNSFGAALSFVILPLGIIINLIQSFRRNWDMITAAFKTGGIKAGLLAIGKTIVDAVLMPLQQLLELISRIPVFSDLAGNAAIKIQTIRENIGVNTTTDEAGVPLVNKDATREGLITERNETLEKQQLDININAPSGLAEIAKRGAGIPILLTTTQGFE